jgi:ribosomal protein S18 acetylase RimI-like enzyme
VRIIEVQTPEHYAAARELFVEYAAQLGHDLCFQDFAAELADLPGTYAPPASAVLLAEEAGAWLGCVALRSRGPDICEMKRLYVRPALRRTGLGRRLAQAIIERARQAGYARMRLDTLGSMTIARTLYESLGFRVVPAYYDNPIAGVVFYELQIGE